MEFWKCEKLLQAQLSRAVGVQLAKPESFKRVMISEKLMNRLFVNFIDYLSYVSISILTFCSGA